MRIPILPLLCSLLLTGLIPANSGAQTASDSPIERLKSYHYGDNTALLDAVTALVDAARANPTQRPKVAQELADVLQSDASFDAKEFACRELVPIAGEAQIPSLMVLLNDTKLAHYALLVLARIPGKTVNDALLAQLANTHDYNQLEILNVLADRSDERAVAGLTLLLKSPDVQMRLAAANALAKLPSPKAVIALYDAYDAASAANRQAFGEQLLTLVYRNLGRDDPGNEGTENIFRMFTQVQGDPVLRAMAFRGMVRIWLDHSKVAAPLSLILPALHENGMPIQSMAINLTRELPGTEITKALTTELPKLNVHGQLLVLTALGERGDPAAASGVETLCHAADASVRLAALHTLGLIGNESAVALLVTTAATGSAQDAEVARESLTRLRGATVDKKLMALAATQTEESATVEILAALGRRRTAGAMPVLIRAAASPKPKISTAAFGVLREMGSPDQLSPLLDLLLNTAPDRRDPAIGAVSAIARRGLGEEQRTFVLRTKLISATNPADRSTLLTVLDQVGGPIALLALKKGLTDTDAEVRATSLSLLADWPDEQPLEDLKQVALSATEARQRTIALRGYLRMVAADETRPTDRTLALYRSIAPLATRPDDKRQILSGLSKVHSAEALRFAYGFLKDPEVRPEAETAVVEIGRATIGAFPEQTRAALEPIAGSGVDETARKNAAQALILPAKLGDFLGAWEVSPAFQRAGMDYLHLFDTPFPPETAGQENITSWRLMPIVTDPEHPWLLDLLAYWGGEQRVAYLRTAVWSESARDLVLEMGSDDGLKVWWNGQIVLAHNVARGVAPGQEKVTVHLNAGWNTLLLKVTQNVMGWGACARFTNKDGSPVTGLKFSVPSEVNRK